MNSINPSKRIQFTLSCLTDSVLELLDLTLSFDDTLKTEVLKLFITPTNSFDYVMLSACFPWRNIEKNSEDVALRLR